MGRCKQKISSGHDLNHDKNEFIYKSINLDKASHINVLN